MPYTFSKASEAKLAGLDPLLVRVVRRAMSYGVMDFTVVQTLRTPEEAAANLAKGTSATTHSKHLPDARGLARAVDLAPFPIDWADQKRFGLLMGLMAAAAAEMFGADWRKMFRMGGNWDGDNDFHDNRPEDPGHFELV